MFCVTIKVFKIRNAGILCSPSWAKTKAADFREKRKKVRNLEHFRITGSPKVVGKMREVTVKIQGSSEVKGLALHPSAAPQ